jgi:MbtH protein
MTNPVSEGDIAYRVLIDVEGQYCIWPDIIEAPTGWITAHGPCTRKSADDYVERYWTYIGPDNFGPPPSTTGGQS